LALVADAEGYPLSGRASERNRKAALAVLHVGLDLNRVTFDLGDREAARLAAMPVSCYQEARVTIVALKRWFTYRGSPGQWMRMPDGSTGRRAGRYRLIIDE